jgi:hypothetical protein
MPQITRYRIVPYPEISENKGYNEKNWFFQQRGVHKIQINCNYFRQRIKYDNIFVESQELPYFNL